MITHDLNVVTVEGEVQGEVIAMSLEETAFDHVMEQLTRLYPHPIRAVIRETSTNADDARIEARSAKPTEVRLPSRLNPMFTVRDYGTGMDHDTIVYIYSRYGASTKRHSNDFNGALGFGCKAPLAYTPQFTVVTVKNGLRNIISCARKPSGGGNMIIVPSQGIDGREYKRDAPTDEPDGTMVMVPAASDDVDEFRAEADAFYANWKPGTVVVNGEEPNYVQPLLRLTPRFSVVKGDTDEILMANVAYPVDRGIINHGIAAGFALRAEVPTGDVSFVGSREALEMNPHTRETLRKVEADFKAACAGAVQRKIDEATTKAEALSKMVYWDRVLPRAAKSADGNYTFEGAILPSRWRVPKSYNEPWPFLTAPIKSYIDSRHDTAEAVEAANFARDIFVLGFVPGNMIASHKERLNMWRNDTDADRKTTGMAERYILCRADELPADVKAWIDPARVVTWSHIKANYKIERATASGGYGSWKQVKGSYEDVWTENGAAVGETPADKIRQDKPIFFFQTREWHYRNAVEALKSDYPAFTLVKLQANRVGKFQRDFPAAQHVRTVLDGLLDKFLKSVTLEQRKAAFVQSNLAYGLPILQDIDPAKIDDPALREIMRLGKIDLKSLTARANVFGYAMRRRVEVPHKEISDPLSSYPMLMLTRHQRPSPTMKQHILLYINAAFAAKS